MSNKGSTLAITALTLAAALFAPATQAVTITRGFAGLWHDTNAKRGFSAEVVDTAQGKQLVAYWITTDAAGKPMWVIGQGPIVGNRAVLAAVVGNSARASSGTQSWGQMTVSFSDCAHGTVQFAPTDPRQQRGQTTIARPSPDAGKSCSGGISDDHGGADVRIVQFFTNTGVVPAASGKARFEARSDRSDFKVEAEDLPIGDYSLRVAGAEKATLTVTTSVNGAEGEVEFRDPPEPNHLPLDFDPRGQHVEIRSGGGILSGTFPTQPSGGGNGDGGNGGGGNDDPPGDDNGGGNDDPPGDDHGSGSGGSGGHGRH
jgi:hypothetical protein